MSSPAGTCTAITHLGARCASLANDSTGQCSHHARMARLMALVPKALAPPVVTFSSGDLPSPSPSPSSSSSSSLELSPFKEARYSDHDRLLPGETVISTVPCSFVFPGALALPEIPGALHITPFRLRFEPQRSSLRVRGEFHRLLDMAMGGMPRASIAKLSYPQATAAASRSLNSYSNGGGVTPTRLVIQFKDLRSWVLGGDVVKLLLTLNRYAYVDSALSLFAFKSMEFLTPDDLQGHALYDLYQDFARMGIDLKDGSSAYRVTELNAAFAICPTYPRQIVVPAAASDSEVEAVASFRSKGRLPICSYVHTHNGAALWRCAQPKRGILHTQNAADEQYLLHIAGASSGPTSLYSGTRIRKIWIADCRPELNARVNNLTGGGTESGNLVQRVDFLNIGNIHAMRESMEAVRSLGGFMAPTNNTEAIDLSWGTRVEDTKWLLHVRRVLSGALQVARALVDQATTVVVHCSDGWDRTAQLCGLAQLLVDGHYRTRRGFLEVIEKEWVRAGHKFQDRVAPGKAEDDDDQQAPIFVQFLDCVWQLIRIFPTHFEFNERMLETMADAVFSGRYGTFLGNCECERGAWSVRERTPSLYASVLKDDRFVNPFYRGTSTAALLPDSSSVLRQVTLWTSYYFRGAPFPATPAGNSTPPMYAVNDSGEGNAVSSGAQEDMEIAMMAALRRIRALEDELSTATAQSAHPPRPAPVSYPPLYSAAAESDMSARTQQNSQPGTPVHRQSFTSDFHHSCSSRRSSSSDESVNGTLTPPVLPQAPTSSSTSAPVSIQPLLQTAPWTCSLCTKINALDVFQCVVCGRTPR